MGKHTIQPGMSHDETIRRNRRARRIHTCIHIVGEFALGSATIVAMEWTHASSAVVHQMSVWM